MCRELSISCVALALALSIPALRAQAPPPDLTLEQALQTAFERSPELVALRAEVEELRARRVTAQTYPYNPEVSARGARRTRPGASSTDGGLEVS